MKERRWVSFAIVALALVLRLVQLDVKPAHFDEGVNGWFVDFMTRTGYYHYDPTNFHGPLHFYVLFFAQTLLGRAEWVLRLPLALVSTACVALMVAFRPYVGRTAAQIAALGMAISPAFVFYGRYAIHESWFVLFLMLTTWGLAGLCHFGTRPHLWAAAAGVTGLILTKETYIIHFIALASGYGVLRWWERYFPSAPFTAAEQQWTMRDLQQTIALSLGAIVLFYSGFGLDWSGLGGLVTSLFAWARTGMEGQSGHEKEPWYWFTLMSQYEWPALIGVFAALGLSLRGMRRTLRWIALSAAAALFAYSIVAYKTPWCILAIIWPFHLIFGAAVVRAGAVLDRWVIGVLAALALAVSGGSSLRLNFRHFADEREPYAYVQTLVDLNKLMDPLRTLAARDPANYHLPGFIVMADVHPLPWLLADFPRIPIKNLTEVPADISASEVFLVAEEYVEEMERRIAGSWYREKITLRGTSGATQMLYFRADRFAEFFPGREPEFHGPTPSPVPPPP